jgi:hypothetical protein
VGSGGGGTLPAEKVTLQNVHDAIRDSRNVIDAFLKGAERDYVYSKAYGQTSLFPVQYALFFSGNETVFDVISRVKIKILDDGPCVGIDGKPYDGSVNEGPNTICMSASQMVQKLSWTNYHAEVAALMLHEISHLLGATEDQAVEIQKYAVRVFASKDSFAVFQWTYEEMERLSSYSQILEMTAMAVQARAKIQCSDLINILSSGTHTVWRMIDGGHMMFLARERDMEYNSQIAIRLLAIRDFLCAQPEFGNEYERKVYQDKIQKIFGNDLRIESSHYLNVGRPEPLVMVWIPRYQTIDEAVADIQAAKEDMDKLNQSLNEQWELKFPTL